MNIFEYEPRRVEFHETILVGDHQLKIYTLSSSKFSEVILPPKDKLVMLLEPGLPDPKLETDHKVGFAILHWANDGLYTLINTWFDANMLRMKAFKVDDFNFPQPKITSLDYLNVIACVWELEIYKYERDMWVNTVLRNKPRYLTSEITDNYLTYGLRGYA